MHLIYFESIHLCFEVFLLKYYFLQLNVQSFVSTLRAELQLTLSIPSHRSKTTTIGRSMYINSKISSQS